MSCPRHRSAAQTKLARLKTMRAPPPPNDFCVCSYYFPWLGLPFLAGDATFIGDVLEVISNLMRLYLGPKTKTIIRNQSPHFAKGGFKAGRFSRLAVCQALPKAEQVLK